MTPRMMPSWRSLGPDGDFCCSSEAAVGAAATDEDSEDVVEEEVLEEDATDEEAELEVGVGDEEVDDDELVDVERVELNVFDVEDPDVDAELDDSEDCVLSVVDDPSPISYVSSPMTTVEGQSSEAMLSIAAVSEKTEVMKPCAMSHNFSGLSTSLTVGSGVDSADAGS